MDVFEEEFSPASLGSGQQHECVCRAILNIVDKVVAVRVSS